jgi:response regulator RpfG family c-di-GMP phosphodiesterase
MTEAVRVLVVEDNPADVELIREYLPGLGHVRFQIESVPRLSEALTRLSEEAADLMLIDLGLPDSQGLETFLKLQKAAPETPAIILTGYDDEEAAVTAVRNGAQDYLIKGELNGSVLVRAARYAMERKRAEESLRSEQKLLSRTEGVAHVGSWSWEIATDTVTWSDELFRIFQRDPRQGAPSFAEHPAFYHPDDMARLGQAVAVAVADGTPYELELRAIRKDGETRVCVARGVAEMAPGGRAVRLFGSLQDVTERKKAEAALQETLLGLRKALNGTVQILSAVSEIRDPYTAGHQRRVGELARAIAQDLGLGPARVEGIRVGGVIHDIGKLSVPAEILSKPARLTKFEYELIKSHPQIGHDILAGTDFAWPLAAMALQHHERMDGSGYPQGLKGEAIILDARILAVADVIEAMASHRPYRPAIGIEAALEEIEKNSGLLYDSDVVAACLRLFREEGFRLA